ncbi:SpoIIE family protein phosphatase [Nocardioides sp. zg-DK7169]|uniref:SpoIIE family protein phosphatase n=1 Tax=Nocardioides sp. zg-DK7169 TaxID=2736600 RepID=UPI0015523E6E|nr:SpoIIE family protein phosphatase [Nocardioides sp. zg-DK7169]NPC96903.1 SpoIIE family protein phosphatase [Nocardioides sp. zg-DK7169]
MPAAAAPAPRGGAEAHTPAYEPATLSNCEREPIHVPGAIQPHGVLLAVDADLRVVMASENVKEMVGLDLDRLLGAELADVLGEGAARTIADSVERTGGEALRLVVDDVAARFGALGAELDVNVHRSGERIIVEVEPALEVALAMPSYRLARGAMQRLARTSTVLDLSAQLATEVAGLTGFDRVMVYRFDEDWNGEVVAEERRADLNPFLGLHYPSTDIPAQARRLYTVNWTRLIADVGYLPVALSPVHDPGTGRPLDLSHSVLRSVSPIHLEYLGNMGVTASMSVSLVVDGELWGLIACHHYSGPHRPGHDVRAASEFLGQAASQLIAERQRADLREARLASGRLLTEITARTSASGPRALESLIEDPDLLALMGATGVALCFDGVLSTLGTVPDEDVVRRVAQLLRRGDNKPAAVSRLSELDPDLAEVEDVAAGALVIGAAPDRWLAWFRPELRRVVDWGGDPTNKLLARAEDPDVRLSPRKSFEKWQQVVRGRGATWEPWHLDAAVALDSHLASLLFLHAREQIDVAESLQRSVIPQAAPQFDGLEVLARYVPASTFQLGGDWWDAFALDDGRVAFVVGDVAGHGVAAATTMTQVRSAVRAHLFAGESPASALDRTDRFMDGLFEHAVATALIAVVDPVSGSATLAAAGHPPPFLVDSGASHELEVGRRPLLGLGVVAAVESELQLAPGATLLLYSDGLIERRGVNLGVSLAQLGAIAPPGERPEDFERWADRLLAAVPGKRDDDTTILAVRVRPQG